MVDDPDSALRAEMQAAIDSLVPQIGGLQTFAKMSLSTAAISAITAELVVRQRRFGCLNAVVGAIGLKDSAVNSLYADGYPNFPPNQGAQAVFLEIQTEEAELGLAADLFRGGADTIGLDLTSVIHRQQPIPKS